MKSITINKCIAFKFIYYFVLLILMFRGQQYIDHKLLNHKLYNNRAFCLSVFSDLSV